jgi:hypothetical protein
MQTLPSSAQLRILLPIAINKVYSSHHKSFDKNDMATQLESIEVELNHENLCLLTPDKLDFSTLLRSAFDNPSWNGI